MRPLPLLLMARELNLGGTERQLAEIARSLDRDCFAPHVGCFHTSGFRAEELREAGVPVVRFPVESFHSPSLVRGIRAMGSYIREHGIQLVHTFDVPMNLFGVPAAHMYRVPRVLSSQRAHRDLTPGLTRHLLRFTDQITDGIVVNCLSVKRELIEEDRVPARRIHLCYNGVDTSLFHPPAAPRSGPGLTIGIVCALRPEKDLGTLLHAFAQIRTGHENLRLKIVGSGPAGAAVESIARELQLGDAFALEPATNRVAEALGMIDIFVLPSLSEAFSNSLMEAMACGCAAVASRAGGNPELITEGHTGLLFEPGDPASLSACLRLLIQNADLRARLAEAAALRMAQEFSLEASARRMGRIYSTLFHETFPRSAESNQV